MFFPTVTVTGSSNLLSQATKHSNEMASPSAGTSTSSQEQQPTPVAVASAAVGAGAAAAPIGILRKSSNITNKASGAGDATTLSGTSSDGSSSGGTDPPGNKSQTAHAVQIVTDKPAASVETAPPQPGALCDRDAEGELAALMTSASRSARRSAAAETSLVPSRRGFPPTLLRRLFLTECNSYCVDCGRREDGIPDKLTTFAAAAPTSANSEDVKMRLAWANVNYGTVLCGRCALQHLAVEGDDEVRSGEPVRCECFMYRFCTAQCRRRTMFSRVLTALFFPMCHVS